MKRRGVLGAPFAGVREVLTSAKASAGVLGTPTSAGKRTMHLSDWYNSSILLRFSLELTPCLFTGTKNVLKASILVSMSFTKNWMSALCFHISFINATPSSPPNGWFATMIVPLVYFQTILVQPFTYFLYEKYFMNASWKQCFCCCIKRSPQVVQPVDLRRTSLPILEEGNPNLNYNEYQAEEEKQGRL